MVEPALLCPSCKTEMKLAESFAARSSNQPIAKRLAQKDANFSKRDVSLSEQEEAQSKPPWLDPFIIITALPGALAGIAWALFLTHTRLSEPALTGAIMTMGTATANSILVVSYARERLEEHGDALRAAIEAGTTRFRPVLMTASAMIMGMVPMATGYSANAPLGRAVIGGLLVATLFTLFFVPCVYTMLYTRRTARQEVIANG